MVTKAFADGLKDGAEWDLDGFDSIEQAANQDDGWDETTINAMGAVSCAKAWGVEVDTEAFSAACAEYNRGVVAAIRARMADEVQP